MPSGGTERCRQRLLLQRGPLPARAFLRHDAARLRSRLPHRRRSGGLHAERTRPARAQHLGRVRQLRRERALGSRQGAARQLARHLLRPCHERRRPGSTRPPAALLGPQALQRQRTLQGYRQQKRRPPVPDPVRRKEMGAGSPGRQRRYEPEPLLAGRRRRHGPLRQLQHALHVGRFRDRRRYREDLHAHRQRLPVARGHHAPECRRNGLRRLRRNPETGRRVRHGQRPLPHHGLHRRRPDAADHRPRRRLQRKRILEVQTPDLRRRTGDVQNVPEPRTALLRQRVLERHDLARRQQENSQRPVLFQRQLGSGQIAPTRRSTPPPATGATWISPYSAMRRFCSTTSRRSTSTIRRMRTSRST